MKSIELKKMSMAGTVTPLVAVDRFNVLSRKNQCSLFSWTCDPNFVDALQVFVICPAQVSIPEEIAPYIANGFDSCVLENNHVLYWDKSRMENGVIPGGVVIPSHTYQAFKRSLVFCAGLCLSQKERETVGRVHLDFTSSASWKYVHPSNFMQDVFSGYRFMDLRGLEAFTLIVNNLPWYDLKKSDLHYLQQAGMHWFPMILHPLRLDYIRVVAQWSLDYAPMDENVAWHSVPAAGPCCCQQGSYITPNITRKQIETFYNNQSPEARAAVFIEDDGTLIHQDWMTNDFWALLQNHFKEGVLQDIELDSIPTVEPAPHFCNISKTMVDGTF